MQLFFVSKIEGDFAYLNEEEARHVVQVLRKKEGDILNFVDGKGGFYESEIVETARKKCVVKITKHENDFEKRNFHLHIAIAPTKNIARYEWFLEKATEIGIDEITPIFCSHSERKKVRLDRLEKVLVSAMKQSLKAFLPKLNEPISFSNFIKSSNFDNQEKFIAHCENEQKLTLQNDYQKDNDLIILIGPEGDFSPKEIELANEHGFRHLSLGKSRLRTETAGVVACTNVNFLNEDI